MRKLLLVALVAAAACGVRDESGGGVVAPRVGEGDQVVLPDCPVDALDEADGVVQIEL
jgi:hypothetical protein